MEDKNGKVKVRDEMWHQGILLSMRIALFVCLMLLSVGVIVLCGFFNCTDNVEGSKNEEEFYDTEAFQSVLSSWSSQMSCYMMNYFDVESTLDSDVKLYSLTEYGNVTKDCFPETGADVKTLEQVSKAKDILMSDLRKDNPSVANNILDGVDSGEEYAYFYFQLQKNLQDLAGVKDIKSFIHLNGREYYALLDKYCNESNLKQDIVESQFSVEMSNFADSYEAYKETELEGEITDSSSKIMEPRGLFNEYNGNLLAYSYYGGVDGNGHLMLSSEGSVYDYAMKDVAISDDFYIPATLLDYSSQENFEKSLITTPFTTVREVMAFLSMQSYMEEHGEGVYAHYFTQGTLNEFEYAITYLDKDKKEQILTNCDENRLRSGVRIVYDVEKGTVTMNDTALDYQEVVDLFKSFKEPIGVKRVTLRVDSGFGFNALGGQYLLSLAANHKDGLLLAGVLLAILTLILIVGIFYLLPAKVYQRDKHYLVTKTLIYGGLVVASVTGGYCLLEYLFYIGMHFDSKVRLAALGIAVLFLLGIVYIAITEYLFSIIRLSKAKQFKRYLLLHKLYGQFKRFIKHAYAKAKVMFKGVWHSTGYTKRLVIKRALVLFAILSCMFMLMLSLVAGAGFFIMFFFLLLVAILAYEGYNIYQLVEEQKMLDRVLEGITRLVEGDLSYQIDTSLMKGDKKELAEMVNRIGEGLEKAVAQSIKDERLKAELITNVSHDIKTPLTSIINYVDLMKRENITKEPLKGYIEVLEQKAQRLKQLTEDLVEASKASTGNIELEPVNLNMTELLSQTIGEFEDKFSERSLTLVTQIAEEQMVIYADGRRCYRIFENLFQNVYKYAMPNTRVYLNLEPEENKVVLCMKNISEAPLLMDVSELIGRFVRGDASRTTEGSGLGLSIAQSLTTLQNGSFDVELDGDLFKVTITFERHQE